MAVAAQSITQRLGPGNKVFSDSVEQLCGIPPYKFFKL